MSFFENEQISDLLNLDGCGRPRFGATSPVSDAPARLGRDVIASPHFGTTALSKRRRLELRVIRNTPLRGFEDKVCDRRSR
jgi:hypothetical protein